MKIIKLIVCNFLCFVPLAAYDFANIAHAVHYDFEVKKIRSSFGKNLFNEVQKATHNFTLNLTFSELKKYVDPVYLDYMAREIIKTNPNTYVALIWPVTVGQDEIIENILNKYCNIICYEPV